MKKYIYALISSFLLLGCNPQEGEESQLQDVSVSIHHTSSVPSHQLLTRAQRASLELNSWKITSPEQQALLFDLSENLVDIDKNGQPVPRAAESWNTTDNKTWRFRLRPHLAWSNGQPLTAKDFILSWQRLAQSYSPLKHYLAYANIHQAQEVITNKLPAYALGINALDEVTIEFQLDKPTPYFPSMLAHIAWLPHYYTHDGIANLTIGNGAYRLVGQNAQGVLLLEKNPHYWQSENVAFQQVTYEKISATAQQKEAVKWDIVSSPPFKNEQTYFVSNLCVYFYEFNQSDPFLTQKNVRQALTSMISQTQATTGLNTLVPTGDFLPKRLITQVAQNASQNVPEPLLMQSHITEKNPLTLRLTYLNQVPYQQIAQQMIQMFSQSDLLRVSGEPVDRTTLIEKYQQGMYQLIGTGWCADYQEPSAFLSRWYSQHVDNLSHYHNPKVDNLFKQAMEEGMNTSQRTQIYERIYQQILQDHVVLPIFQYGESVYLNSSIGGVERSNLPMVISSKEVYRELD